MLRLLAIFEKGKCKRGVEETLITVDILFTEKRDKGVNAGIDGAKENYNGDLMMVWRKVFVDKSDTKLNAGSSDGVNGGRSDGNGRESW